MRLTTSSWENDKVEKPERQAKAKLKGCNGKEGEDTYVQTGHGAHNGYRGSFSGVKRPGRVIAYPHPSSFDVKNE